MKDFIAEHLEGAFFTKGVSFGSGTQGEEEKLCAFIRGILLLEQKAERKVFESVTAKNAQNMKKQVVDSYGEDEKRKIWDVMDFLADAGFTAHPFLTPDNVPFVIACARWALEKDKSPKSFCGLVELWEKSRGTIGNITDEQKKMQYFESTMKKYY